MNFRFPVFREADFCFVSGMLLVFLCMYFGHNILGGFVYYSFDDEIVSIELEDAVASGLTFGYVSMSELAGAVEYFSLPKGTLSRLNESSFSACDMTVFDDCIFCILRVSNARFAVYVKKNLLLVVPIEDRNHEIRDICILPKSVEEPSLARLIYIFLDRLISLQGEYLSHKQEQIYEMERQMLSSREEQDFNIQLFRRKQILSELYVNYDRMMDFVCLLKDDDFGDFDENDKKCLSLICERISRLKENVRMLCDSVVHLRDAYQSNIEVRLNQIMKIFTVFTVIFSPLSFIAGWYGMNFRYMPELSSRFGYPGVIIFVICVTVSLLAWFKHKKWI